GTSGCATISNPSATTVTCTRVGLARDGRLPPCRSSENCVSSSSVRSPAKFSAPWNYATETSDAKVAFNKLLDVIPLQIKDANLVDVNDDNLYILAEFPAKVPPGSVDVVEFLLRPADNVCSFRSATRDSVFVYPLQQPVSDRGSNRDRLEAIRNQLGWAAL
ncbi:hypothetical protein JKP88DRAFT_155378, partial [Tribonema minus]